ncbi:sodium:alanine symporter family protein [Vermiphilus pyriformis]|jgi:AGCS family alanine or glycine:cation symporter|nr:MAG: sodium:alanine symporter family protein [Vermiphilus pyriformis]
MLVSALYMLNQCCVLFNEWLAVPTTILFFGAALFLTFKTGVAQIRALPRFWYLIRKSYAAQERQAGNPQARANTISPFHALFTAMATTIGIGNVVGPSIAIFAGGPGALLWLLIYLFFGSVTKFVEVTFALHTRTRIGADHVIGGPMQYLKLIHPALARWYVMVMVFLFMAWSGLQANTLASIVALENISAVWVGIVLALSVYGVVSGGARRVGVVASTIVPVMFVLYICFALGILWFSREQFIPVISMMFTAAFTPSAIASGLIGASIIRAMHAGIFRGIYISEAGLGTSSIAHSVADVNRSVDQGVLAMVSMVSDACLALLSGLIVLVTGVWHHGQFRSTFVYEAFASHAPVFGRVVLIVSIALFALTTVIGNSFNGMQTFLYITNRRWGMWYLTCTMFAIMAGALLPVAFMWNAMDVLLTLVAVPNLIGIILLACRYPQVLSLKSE